MPKKKDSLKTILAIYIFAFLFSLHYTIPIYVNSSFLSTFIAENLVGVIYTVGSLLTILFFLDVPYLLRRFGIYRTTVALIVMEFGSLFGLILFKNPAAVILSFVANFILVTLIGFNIDVLLESETPKASTGNVRGSFLTVINFTWIMAPVIASGILTNGDYWKIYLVALCLLALALVLFGHKFSSYKDRPYERISLAATLKKIQSNKNVRNIFVIAFLMQLFFAWMVIYTPLYLHNTIGFTWKELGIMFSIMLVPFVILEAPLGRLADRKWGEKEMLSVGFIIMGVTTALMALYDIKNAVVWAALLFATRVGASVVEIMSETYFFKVTKATDVSIVSLYRTMRPLAYLAGPIIATVILQLTSFPNIFLILGALMLYGLRYSLTLKDTR